MILWPVSKFRRFRFTVSEALAALFQPSQCSVALWFLPQACPPSSWPHKWKNFLVPFGLVQKAPFGPRFWQGWSLLYLMQRVFVPIDSWSLGGCNQVFRVKLTF